MPWAPKDSKVSVTLWPCPSVVCQSRGSGVGPLISFPLSQRVRILFPVTWSTDRRATRGLWTVDLMCSRSKDRETPLKGTDVPLAKLPASKSIAATSMTGKLQTTRGSDNDAPFENALANWFSRGCFFSACQLICMQFEQQMMIRNIIKQMRNPPVHSEEKQERQECLVHLLLETWGSMRCSGKCLWPSCQREGR